MYFCIVCREPHKKKTAEIWFENQFEHYQGILLPLGVCKQDTNSLFKERTSNQQSKNNSTKKPPNAC